MAKGFVSTLRSISYEPHQMPVTGLPDVRISAASERSRRAISEDASMLYVLYRF